MDVVTVRPRHIFPIHNPQSIVPAHEFRELLQRHVRREDLRSCFVEGERGCLVCVDGVGVFAGFDYKGVSPRS